MPKPVVVPTEWATNAVHLVGDYPGSATKVAPGAGVIAAGLIPGDIFAPTAEELNHVWNNWTDWLIWVSDGKSLGDADAHIVETDSNGIIRAQQVIAYPSAAFNTYAIQGTGIGSGPGVVGISSGGSQGGIKGQNTAGGLGGDFSSTSGNGVQGSGGGSGYGGLFYGGSTDGPGILASGGAGVGPGPGAKLYGAAGAPDIELETNSNNYGIDMQLGPNALVGGNIVCNGQIGWSIYSSPGYQGIWMSGSQTIGVAQMYMQCLAAGDGLNVSSAGIGTGHLIKLTPKQASPSKAPLLLEGQNGLPSGTVEGGIGYDRTAQKFYNGRRNVASPMYFWDGPSGLGPAQYNVTGQVTNSNAAVPTTAITKALNLGAVESAWVVVRLDLGWTVGAENVTVTVAFDGSTQYQREIYMAYGASDSDQVKQVWMWQGKATNVTTVTVTIARTAAGTVWARYRSLIALQTIYSNEWV